MTDPLAFFAVSALVIMTPGQDTALTIRNTLRGGRAGGIGTAFGVSSGQAVWTLAASTGAAAVLAASEAAFTVVRLAGAAYLVFLGVQSLRGALGREPRPGADEGAMALKLSLPDAVRQGLLSNLGNPKMAVFFTSLLPQFAESGGSPFTRMLVLGLVFCAMTLVWLTVYTGVVMGAGSLLRSTGVHRALEGAMGAVLLALGVWVALEELLG